MKRLPIVLAALGLTGAAPDAPDAAGSYRARFAVTAAPGGGVQRIALPAAALAEAQTRDLSDLRIFDARGRAMPIARAPETAPALRRDTVAAMPILGPADGLRVTGMSLQLDEQGRARVTQLDGSVRDAAGETVLLGALFDTRAIAGVARRLVLDADVPASQPITFTVEASRNLKDWRRIGEDVVYRGSDAGQATAVIALDGTDLRRDYLRVTWRSGSRLLAPVGVRSAELETRPTGRVGGVQIAARLSETGTARTIDFALPFATIPTAISIVPTGDELIVPVRILGRDTTELPWSQVGSGIARATDAVPIALSGQTFRTMRIAADDRTPGFTSPPAIRLIFAARSIAFLAAGQAPYTLAVGRPGAAGLYLPLESLTGQPAKPLPDATVTAPTTIVELTPVDGTSADKRTWLLWAILIGATALLAGMAWLLWRRNAAPGDATNL